MPKHEIPEEDDLSREYQIAQEALRRGSFREAHDALQNLMERFPKDPSVRWMLGYSLLEMGQDGEAIATFRKTLEIDPLCVPAWGGLGHAYVAQCRFDEAARAFKRRLELQESPNHYVFLAATYTAMERYQEAVHASQRAIDLDASCAEGYLNLALAKRGLQRSEEAIRALHQAIFLEEDYALAHRELGFQYLSMGRFAEAEKHLRRSIELNPGDSQTQLLLATGVQSH